MLNFIYIDHKIESIIWQGLFPEGTLLTFVDEVMKKETGIDPVKVPTIGVKWEKQ